MFVPPPARSLPSPIARAGRGEWSAHPAARSGLREETSPVLLEGLAGPVELRRAPGGFLQVWPRPTPESQRALYGEKFYEEDKSTYLSDVDRDRAYWDAIWSIRRGMMEAALPATPGTSSSTRAARASSPNGSAAKPAPLQAATASGGTHRRSIPACRTAGAVSTGCAQ